MARAAESCSTREGSSARKALRSAAAIDCARRRSASAGVIASSSLRGASPHLPCPTVARRMVRQSGHGMGGHG